MALLKSLALKDVFVVVLTTIILIGALLHLMLSAPAIASDDSNHKRIEQCRAQCGQYKFYNVVVFSPVGQSPQCLCVSD